MSSLYGRMNKRCAIHLERKTSETGATVKPITEFVKLLEVNLSSLQDEISLLAMTREEEMGSYGEQKTVARRRIEKVTEIFLSRFVGMVVCVSRAIPDWYKPDILELKNYGKRLYQN